MEYTWDPEDTQTFIQEALEDYNSKVTPESKVDLKEECDIRQQNLSQALDKSTLKNIKLENQHNVHYQAHLNLTTNSGAGSWLHAVPSRALGTHVDPLIYGTMVKRWLRVPIYPVEYHCPYCDDMVDRYGDHCLTCACGGDRTKRHNLLRNAVFHHCNSIGLNPELERPGLLQQRPLLGAAQENGIGRDTDGSRRPADVYLPKWRRGTPAALDFAVTSGLRADMINRSAEDGSAASKSYEDYKCYYMDTKSKCEEEGITFIPVICEANGGGWGPAANIVWNDLAKHKSLLTGETKSIIAAQLLQSLGIILHRENARAVLRRAPNSLGHDSEELLAASVDL